MWPGNKNLKMTLPHALNFSTQLFNLTHVSVNICTRRELHGILSLRLRVNKTLFRVTLKPFTRPKHVWKSCKVSFKREKWLSWRFNVWLHNDITLFFLIAGAPSMNRSTLQRTGIVKPTGSEGTSVIVWLCSLGLNILGIRKVKTCTMHQKAAPGFQPT